MANAYHSLSAALSQKRQRWLVTGAAGFIGSHIIEKLLSLDQEVVGLDNFATGSQKNLATVRASVGSERAERLIFIEGDIRDAAACERAVEGCTAIIHQAALASVPRSIDDPVSSTNVNVGGFSQLVFAAHKAGVKRFVYASSSSVYGDSPTLPKKEEDLGAQLSPYAFSKYANELQAGVFHKVYGLDFIGLRYFNVFGPRQDPNGPYAAVMPRWVDALQTGKACEVYGDGETSRDFCFVANAVQANLLAATTINAEALGKAYNIAVGDRTSLTQLYQKLVAALERESGKKLPPKPTYKEFRAGDIKHSLADVTRARTLLGYEPEVTIDAGIEQYVRWLVRDGK